MSDERLDHIEHRVDGIDERLTRIEHRVDVIDERLTRIEHRVDVIDGRLDRIEGSMATMQNRMDSMEGTILLAMREGFATLSGRYNDLDTDLAITERKVEDNARRTRRINHRLMRLEQPDSED